MKKENIINSSVIYGNITNRMWKQKEKVVIYTSMEEERNQKLSEMVKKRIS